MAISCSIDPCSDPYWGSWTQFFSYELTGFATGALLAGALSMTIKGEVQKAKIGLKEKADGWTLIQKNWVSNPFQFEGSTSSLQGLKVSMLKGGGLGLLLGGVAFYVQALAKELFCFS